MDRQTLVVLNSRLGVHELSWLPGHGRAQTWDLRVPHWGLAHGRTASTPQGRGLVGPWLASQEFVG